MDRRLRILVYALGALVATAGTLDVWRWNRVAAGYALVVLGLLVVGSARAARRAPNAARMSAMVLSAATAAFEGVLLVSGVATPTAVPVAAMGFVLVVLLRVPRSARSR